MLEQEPRPLVDASVMISRNHASADWHLEEIQRLRAKIPEADSDLRSGLAQQIRLHADTAALQRQTALTLIEDRIVFESPQPYLGRSAVQAA